MLLYFVLVIVSCLSAIELYHNTTASGLYIYLRHLYQKRSGVVQFRFT